MFIIITVIAIKMWEDGINQRLIIGLWDRHVMSFTDYVALRSPTILACGVRKLISTNAVSFHFMTVVDRGWNNLPTLFCCCVQRPNPLYLSSPRLPEEPANNRSSLRFPLLDKLRVLSETVDILLRSRQKGFCSVIGICYTEDMTVSADFHVSNSVCVGANLRLVCQIDME